MSVFIPKEMELSKFKHVYKLTFDKSVSNTFFRLEKFPIIYLNSYFIYFKQHGNIELVKEVVCDAAIDKYGLQYTLECILDACFNNCLGFYYPLCRYFVDNTLSLEMMKKIISMYNQYIKQHLEREENNEEIGIEKEKEKREKDIQNLIKHYKNNRKKYKYRENFY
jgi:hypothetical protein